MARIFAQKIPGQRERLSGATAPTPHAGVGPVAETVTDTNTRIVAFLDRLPIEGLDVAIQKHIAGFPSGRPAIKAALQEAIQSEKYPNRKEAWDRNLSTFK